VDAPEVPRLQDAAGEALEPYDSYERFFLREYVAAGRILRVRLG
jgi:hypothetical protein